MLEEFEENQVSRIQGKNVWHCSEKQKQNPPNQKDKQKARPTNQANKARSMYRLSFSLLWQKV